MPGIANQIGRSFQEVETSEGIGFSGAPVAGVLRWEHLKMNEFCDDFAKRFWVVDLFPGSVAGC